MLINDTYPVYSKRNYSEAFYLSFCHSGTYTAITCICGRTHFSDEFPLDEEADEKEKLGLQKLAAEKPGAYIEHNGSVSHFSSNEKSVVFACPCNYAGYLEEIVIDHASSIIDYLKAISLAEKKKVDAFYNHVLSVEGNS